MIAKSYEIIKNPTNFLKYNLFLLYGENDGLRLDIRDTIKKKIKQLDATAESLLIYESDIINNEENFYNSIYSGSLFGNKKIITVNNATDKIISQLKDIVEKCPENIFLIIISNILEKKSKLRNLFEQNTKTLSIPCYSDNNRDLEIIANIELKKNNINISRESINLLIEKSNSDRSNLKNEIEKISSFALSKKKIEIEEIKLIINFSGEYKSDILINECLSGNISQYKKILDELYANAINQIFFFRILSNKIQRLLNIKATESEYKNLDSLINASRPPIFWKDKPIIKKQLSIWKIKDLENILYEINDTEYLCKKNPKISKVIFFSFFTKICKKANSFV